MDEHAYRVVGTDEEGRSWSMMLDSLLKSRIETGEETTDDEDVNVYLAGLLHSFLDRSFYQRNASILSSYGGDVLSHAESSADLRLKYRVYKGNADFSLMALGVFGGVPQRQTARALFNATGEVVAERGRLYYRIASSLRLRMRLQRSGVTEVLDKLSDRFETYLRILTHLRLTHLNIMSRLSDGELYHLEREAQMGAKSSLADSGRDRFLDAYGAWLRSGSEEDRQRVNRIGGELREVDEGFRFEGV